MLMKQGAIDNEPPPYIDEDVLAHFEKAFPVVLPDYRKNREWELYEAGKHEVVRYMRKLFEDQRKHSN